MDSTGHRLWFRLRVWSRLMFWNGTRRGIGSDSSISGWWNDLKLSSEGMFDILEFYSCPYQVQCSGTMSPWCYGPWWCLSPEWPLMVCSFHLDEMWAQMCKENCGFSPDSWQMFGRTQLPYLHCSNFLRQRDVHDVRSSAPVPASAPCHLRRGSRSPEQIRRFEDVARSQGSEGSAFNVLFDVVRNFKARGKCILNFTEQPLKASKSIKIHQNPCHVCPQFSAKPSWFSRCSMPKTAMAKTTRSTFWAGPAGHQSSRPSAPPGRSTMELRHLS